MSLSHSPSIVTNGLVMYYDTNNTQKSWKGAPTTNLVSTVPYTSTVYDSCSGPVITTISDATGQSRTVNRYTITAGSGVTPRARIIATGLIAGVDYSFSAKIRYNGGTYAQAWYIDSSKGNPEGGNNNNTFTTHGKNSVYLGNGWYQLTENFNFATCVTGGAWANFGLYAGDATYINQTFDAYDIQFEQNTIATPFINGTRANTQAVIDLTGKNTITATSLTYASNNTFSFNGTTNYIDCGNSSSLSTNNAISVISWFNASSVATYSPIVTKVLNDYSAGWELSNSAGILRVTLRPSANVLNILATTLTTNTWYMSAFTFNGSVCNLYLNGALVGSATSAGGVILNSTQNLFIGYRVQGNAFSGNIPNVMLYGRELSAAEIKQNFNALRGRYGI
jgi:Concanavalin A-like lectin/glucanases superfamily